MNPKEKTDCFIKLHKEQLTKYRQTRELEFKAITVRFVTSNLHQKAFILLAF